MNFDGRTAITPDCLHYLHELFPATALFGVLLNPKYPAVAQQVQELSEAARTVGRPIAFQNASTDAEIGAAFAALAQQRVAAVAITGDPFFDTRRDQIIARPRRGWDKVLLAG